MKFIQLQEQDSVVVLFENAEAGSVIEVGGQQIKLRQDVQTAHKVAIRPVRQGEHVYKYGYSIGVAKTDIEPGEWVHTHNLKTGLSGILEYSYNPVAETQAALPVEPATFQGYVRENGKVGIRNEVWIIHTVGCITKTCEILTRMGNEKFAGRDIDGIQFFSHPYGCSQLGDDLEYTQKLLAALVNHPNAGAVLVVGLGCENNQIDMFKKYIGDYDSNRVKFMTTQLVDDELEHGMEILEELVSYAETMKRQPVPVSELKVGLKCGGSDGFSGITGNPLVGALSDQLIRHGGTSILTEVPEMFGAETILMGRAKSEQVFDGIVHLVNDFKEYFIRHGQEVYENPSPGNKAGGITTLEEKSLGCTQKGGTSRVVDVRSYGEQVTEKGLNLIQAPGNDQVAVTALTAAGAHIVLFTTGRGTPFGGPVPTVKISTNSDLARRKKNWIDFDAGQLVEDKSMNELSKEFFNYVLDVASGVKKTHNEEFGFREIAIFKDGVTL